MSKILAAIVLAALTASCSTVRARDAAIPRTVVGVTASSTFSGWGLNWCSKGEPVKNLYSRPEWDCPTIGGEIHIVRVKRGLSLADMSNVPTFNVLVPAAVEGTYPHGILLRIVPAASELAADTGVAYWASSFSFIDSMCPGEKPGHWSSACLDKLRAEFANEP
jgi:hypothetical protein